MDIQVLHRQRMIIRGIAKKLSVSRNTVRRYLHDRIVAPQYANRSARRSKLEPFYSYLQSRIEAAKPQWIPPATVLFQEIKTKGYKGGEGIVRNYLRQFKPTADEPVVRFETPPGKQ